MTISTRRFCVRPLGVELSAIGFASPKPVELRHPPPWPHSHFGGEKTSGAREGAVSPARSNDASALHQLDDDGNDGKNEQNVNETSQRVGSDHSKQPKNKKHDEYRPEHSSPPVVYSCNHAAKASRGVSASNGEAKKWAICMRSMKLADVCATHWRASTETLVARICTTFSRAVWNVSARPCARVRQLV